jgi:hypothetical protein
MPSIVTTTKLDASPGYLWEVEEALRKLTEKELHGWLRALLHGMGFFDIRVRHGPREEGKDLLAWHVSRIGSHDWVGFVVKAGNLNAQVASPWGVRTVLYQVEQVLDHDVVDPVTSAQSVVRECWVITSGEIPGHAVDEVAHTLRRHHLEKAVRWVDVTTLARLMATHLAPERLDELLGIDAGAPAAPAAGEPHE